MFQSKYYDGNSLSPHLDVCHIFLPFIFIFGFLELLRTIRDFTLLYCYILLTFFVCLSDICKAMSLKRIIFVLHKWDLNILNMVQMISKIKAIHVHVYTADNLKLLFFNRKLYYYIKYSKLLSIAWKYITKTKFKIKSNFTLILLFS